jgi:hypothetical protein
MVGLNRLLRVGFRNYVALALTGLLLSGCQEVLLSSRGRVVPAVERIVLTAHSKQSGFWETRDLQIHYRYLEASNRLQISGDIRFGDYLRKVYPFIVYFHSGVLLLNDQGRVLATKSLALTNYFADSNALVPFGATFDLPPGTSAIAFTYTGEARSISSSDGGVGTSFYHYP